VSDKTYSWNGISIGNIPCSHCQSGGCDGSVEYELAMSCDLETKRKFENWVAGMTTETSRLDALETALSALNSTVRELSIGLEELSDTIRHIDDDMNDEIIQANNQTVRLTSRYDKRFESIERAVNELMNAIRFVQKSLIFSGCSNK